MLSAPLKLMAMTLRGLGPTVGDQAADNPLRRKRLGEIDMD